MSDTRVELTDWLSTLQTAQPLAHKLLSQPQASQQKQGYFHTLREICQQPLSWHNTADLVVTNAKQLKDCLFGIQNIVLTGSGSSEYAGECVRFALQNQLGISTSAIGGGTLVEHGPRAVPPI